MDKAEVFDLLIVIKENYPNFDVSDDNVERHFKYLNDIPFAVAHRNVDEHIRTNKYPPNIAEIRGRLGEQIERDRMKQETDEYFELLDAWRQNAAPPPPGNLERVRALIKGAGA